MFHDTVVSWNDNVMAKRCKLEKDGTRAVAYLRVSTEEQAHSGAGLAAQPGSTVSVS